MAQIDGAGQQDTDNQNAEALQAALAQREVTAQAQPQGGSDVPSHQNSDPIERRIGNSTAPSGSYQKTSCTVGFVLFSPAAPTMIERYLLAYAADAAPKFGTPSRHHTGLSGESGIRCPTKKSRTPS